jgi:hypothetical protein
MKYLINIIVLSCITSLIYGETTHTTDIFGGNDIEPFEKIRLVMIDRRSNEQRALTHRDCPVHMLNSIGDWEFCPPPVYHKWALGGVAVASIALGSFFTLFLKWLCSLGKSHR